MVNIYQRVVLILGAFGLAVAIWTTPRMVILENKHLRADSPIFAEVKGDLIAMLDVGEASMRAVTVLGMTILLYTAFKGREK